MHIETNTTLLADPLWSALQRGIELFEGDIPYLMGYRPEHEGGLNVDAANRLAAGISRIDNPVYRHRVELDEDYHGQRYLDVFHPDLPTPIAVMLYSNPTPPRNPPAAYARAVAYLQEWQSRRAATLCPEDPQYRRPHIERALADREQELKRRLQADTNTVSGGIKKPAQSLLDAIDEYPDTAPVHGDDSGTEKYIRRLKDGFDKCFVVKGRTVLFIRDRLV